MSIYYGSGSRTFDASFAELTSILADTGTVLVWHAYYQSPTDSHPLPNLDKFAQEIKFVKARLPWVLFQGAVDTYSYCPWSGKPDPDIVYSTSGSYPVGYWGCYPLDIAKPKGAQIVIQFAKYLIDAGADMLHFDGVDALASEYHLPVEPYVSAWKEIASSVKSYASSRYSKEIPVTVNDCPLFYGYGLGHDPGSAPWSTLFPAQDYLDLGLCGKEAAAMIRAKDFAMNWNAIKSAITSTYGRLLPTIMFLDSGGLGDAMPTLANLPLADQVEVISKLHNISLEEGMRLAYPLHGLGETPYEEASKANAVVRDYDAIEHGTYDTIRRLTNSISTITTSPNWPTVRRVITNMTEALGNTWSSARAASFMRNATTAYDRMTQAFMVHDSATVTQQAELVLQNIRSAYKTDQEYRQAMTDLLIASAAIQIAQRENRNSGLEPARHSLTLAQQALQAWNYSGASELALEAKKAAEAATPEKKLNMNPLLTTAAGNVLLAALALTIAIAAAIVVRRKIKRSSKNKNEIHTSAGSS